jgi:voltage-gated potassium channel
MYLQTKTIKNLVIDSVIILIQPYQFINQVLINNYNYQYQSNSDYKLNYVLVIASLLKLTLFLPSLMSMLKLRNPRSSRICNFYGSTNSNLYVIKCYFKIMPIRLVSFIFLSGILAFALSFRVTERNKNFNNENSFEYYQNSIWFAAITVTTVGYGEFYPLTMLGRLVVSLCAFCGSMVTSIMVLVLTKTF